MANFTQQLANTVTSTGVHTAYGDPVDIDGTSILPVSVGAYGFGGGEGGGEGEGEFVEGEDTKGAFTGNGGGGGGVSLPIGAYITREGRTRFEPNIIALLTVGVPFVWVAGKALARVIRQLKR